jgi:DNA-binding transcriptional LysR family regulator
MFDWDDVRLFLAVARAGTTLGAARQLGSSQPTVVRRVGALERQIGLVLFDRGRTGYALTDAGRELVPLAERVEAGIGAMHDTIAARSRRVAGTVRVTAAEPLANLFLAPAVAAFQRARPDIEIQLLLSDEFLDLAQGEADVALRVTIDRPEDSDLVGRLIGEVPWAVYCGPAYTARAGTPAGIERMEGHAVLGSEAAAGGFPAMQWLEETAPGARIVWRSNSLASLQAAARAGLGLAALPCFLGDEDPALVRCFDVAGTARPGLWILAHPRARRLPHVRDFIAALTAHVLANSALLDGSGAHSRHAL